MPRTALLVVVPEAEPLVEDMDAFSFELADGSAEVARALEVPVRDRLRTRGAIRAECGSVRLHRERDGLWECGDEYRLAG